MENLNPMLFGMAFTLFNKLRQPVLLTTTNGDVVHINESAKGLLNLTKLITIKNNQLVLPMKYSQAYFDDCASMEYEFNILDGVQFKSEFKSLRMNSSGSRESLYAFYTLLSPQPKMGVFGMRPLVMMFLYHPDLAPKVDNTILAAAFGLTPGESKTTNLLAEGFSQKEIAEKLGIKHDTVRKQLQSIYYKTSTNKQSELIKLMLNLPSNFIDNTDTNILSNTLEKLRVKVLC